MLMFKRSEYDDDVVDRKVKVLKMMLLIKKSKSAKDVAVDQKVKDVADRSSQSVDVAED